MMKIISKIGLLGLGVISLTGCCRKVMPQISDTRDSVKIVKEIEYIERVRDTTIYVEVPAESKEVIVNTDFSRLETSVALSDAWIDDLGMLGHTLKNKAVKLPQNVPLVDREKTIKEDSVRVRTVYQLVPQNVKYVPFIYKFYKWGFFIALGLLVVTNRGFILNIIKRLIRK